MVQIAKATRRHDCSFTPLAFLDNSSIIIWGQLSISIAGLHQEFCRYCRCHHCPVSIQSFEAAQEPGHKSVADSPQHVLPLGTFCWCCVFHAKLLLFKIQQFALLLFLFSGGISEDSFDLDLTMSSAREIWRLAISAPHVPGCFRHPFWDGTGHSSELPRGENLGD